MLPARAGSAEAGAGATTSSSRPVLLVWLLLSAWTGLPYLSASLDPPPGRTFAGTFHWIDDFYNYVSYAQQAEGGAFLFQNKLVIEDHRGALVNLEWWLVGRLSAVLGRHPFLAYRLLGLALSLALLAAIDSWFRRAGLPAGHRLPALLLVSIAGGIGGLLFVLTDRTVDRCLDLSMGLYPFMETLANPHFVAGTSVLLSALLAFSAGGRRAAWLGAGLGTALGLVRPYDLGLLIGIRGFAVLLSSPPRRWLPELAPLLALTPVLAYDLWLFFYNPAFGFLSRIDYPPQRWSDYALALGPALALALWSSSLPAQTPAARAARTQFWIWFGLGLLTILAQPGRFSSQFLVGLGLPLLCLAALGLARYRAELLLLAALALSSTAVVATRIVLADDPHWFLPNERLAAALVLRDSCRRGDVAFTPPDIGLFTIGLTACRATLSHPAAPTFPRRFADAALFYGGAKPPWRADLLAREGVTHLVLPGDAGLVPAVWLGSATPFRQLGRVGAPPAAISVYARPGQK